MRIVVKAVAVAVLLSADVALAAEQTVSLAVDNMTCATCPVVVKKSLSKVNGVTAVEVSFAAKTASVTFDDDKTTVAALVAATTNAGFPSRPMP